MKLLRNATRLAYDAAEALLFRFGCMDVADQLWNEARTQSSVAAPQVSADSAAPEPPGGSVTPPDVVAAGHPNPLTRADLLDAAHAARCYGYRCATDTAAAKWHRLAHKLHHAK